jgi:hypothetical protein
MEPFFGRSEEPALSEVEGISRVISEIPTEACATRLPTTQA